jgi:hypothetical protein
METVQQDFQSLFGTVAIFFISIAIVLALVGFVLVEMCWVLKLYAEFNRRWKRSLQRMAEEDHNRRSQNHQ